MDAIIRALDAGRDCAIAAAKADYQSARQLERLGMQGSAARANDDEMYRAWIVRRNASALGPTHLIAAMRCFVASRLGEEVDVPGDII